jgi:ABC-2 type transport system ATP-binding protein
MKPVLEFDNIVRSYKKHVPVLTGISMTMSEGEVVALLGRNGAGKTTLIRIAMGVLYPQAGTVRVFGLSPTRFPVEIKRRIGFVAEDQVLPPSATAGELIAFHRRIFPQWDDALQNQLLDRFGISPRSKIRELSKGQARQVALLLAVCHRPEMLILDEPAGGLDPAARREFLETSIQLLNREGAAILFSSHYMSDVERLGGRVVLLDQGKVLLDEELDQLHDDLCVAMLPSSSAPNAAAIEQMRGCLRVRPVADGWHAVFRGSPEAVRERLRDGAHCVRVPLEDLFVELTGGHR